MIYACAQGHVKEAEELIKLGASVNHVEKDGWNALHFAALNNHTDVVDMLLLYDIDVYAETEVRGRGKYYS
jgi:ankyrin repeat protein